MTKHSGWLFLAMLFALAAPARATLTSDQIALVVNRNDPNSIELAQFYAQARGVPPDRIIELDLPTVEEMPFDRYERAVTPAVRQFLQARNLRAQIRCLVTFYGVPLRVSDRANSPSDVAELIALRAEHQKLVNRITGTTEELERLAGSADPAFAPASADGASLESLARRVEHAGRALEVAAGQASDPSAKQALTDSVVQLSRQLTDPVDPQGPAAVQAAQQQIPALLELPYDADARARLRDLARHGMGIFAYARLISSHIEYLATDATASAFDSELALLWWPAYPRTRWLPNPMNPHFQSMSTPPTVMVMRLDAPTPQLVRDMIANSLLTERDGLKGRMIVDSRGIPAFDTQGKPDPFGVFDERLRKLAKLLEAENSIPVKLDSAPGVIPANSEDDVALYCGWYSVRNYVPGMRFNRGAVGYHVASFELMSLRGEHEGGWCRGLIYAGVVGTLGPVAEPYLHSFPAPDEFFPLLLTGRMTLAEVYWTTTPLVSWMQACIGDPLYTPYRTHPAMAVEHLPDVLKTAADRAAHAATQAATSPGR